MIFKKNKNKMIDVRELQKRGVVRIPKKKINIPATKDGFVELNQTTSTTLTKQEEPQSNANFFGFMDNSTTASDQAQTTDNKQLRAQDSRITDLDNKIYKLEQRIELLERKLEVNQSSNNLGAMGW